MKQTKKNIIQVVAYYPPHLGGMENCAKEIAENLARKGHNINVLTSDRGAVSSEKKITKNLRVSYLKSIEIAHTPIIFRLFRKLMQISKSSIIHLHISQALIPEIVFVSAKLRNIPYIAHIHLDVDPSGPLGFLLEPYKQILLKPVLRHASKIICLSPRQKKEIAQKYKLPENKIIVLPNGVGESFFIKRKIEKKEIPTILFVGRLVKQKNLPRLINAISMMKKETRVQIAGVGEDENKIKQLIKKLKLKNVSMLGRVRRGKELINLYKNADIFLLTSNKEGVPLVVLEAMAAGLPIVGPDISGVRELLQGSAILVKEPSAKAFAEELDKLIIDKQRQRKLSQKAQQKARQYKWDTLTKKLESIYEEVSL